MRPQPSTITRLLHELTLTLLSVPNMVRVLRGAQVAVVVIPLLSFAFVASHLAALMGVPRVLLVKAVIPDAAIELGMLRNPAMIALVCWMARCSYALAGEIHTLGEGMRRRIARDARPDKLIRIVSDTIDVDELVATLACGLMSSATGRRRSVFCGYAKRNGLPTSSTTLCRSGACCPACCAGRTFCWSSVAGSRGHLRSVEAPDGARGRGDDCGGLRFG